MIVFHHLTKKYAERTVLDDVSGAVNPHDRIALVGKNGAGKTTLLRLLKGSLRPDAGGIHSTDTIGYVEQTLSDHNSTIRESFRQDSWRVDVALSQVELGTIPVTTPVNQLSGGQKTRLSFAHVLAKDPLPTVLLLDEPTNNLDAEGLQWLHQFMRSFAGAILLVSHDRTFINKATTTIWELEEGTLSVYGGNYDAYKQQKRHEYELRQKRYEENVTERRKVERLIRTAQTRAAKGIRDQRSRDNDKFLKTFKNTQVQNSLGGQAKALQSRLNKLDDVKRPTSQYMLNLDLSGKVHSDKLILKVDDLSKAWGAQQLFSNLTFEIRGNEKVLVTGRNGAGKSTLFRLILGQENADGGDILLGKDVKAGYFAQDMYGLESKDTPLAILLHAGADLTQAYTLARQMGITGNEMRGHVIELSRGQQAKLGLIRLLLCEYELLILDEPTNHLDIETREALEGALKLYRGAVLFASHDSYFQDVINPNHTISIHE